MSDKSYYEYNPRESERYPRQSGNNEVRRVNTSEGNYIYRSASASQERRNHDGYYRDAKRSSNYTNQNGGNINRPNKRRKRKKKKTGRTVILVILIAAIALLLGLILFGGKGNGIGGLFATPTPEPTATPEPTPEPTPVSKFDTPHAVDASKPENWGYTSELEVNGTQVSDYSRSEEIDFSEGSEYTKLDGIITFRGNNFRSTGSFGKAQITNKTLSVAWSVDTGEIMRGTSSGYSGNWTGSLWTGQPLVVKWPSSTKQIMNMYDSAKNNPDLVEVIYATASGKIYFLNLETGEATRDPISLNMPFKGAGALDPRGYPLLYLGSGDMYDDYPDMQTKAMVVSLIDGKVLYEFGKAYDSFALRGWHAYDSSALVSAEADTLIYPGENGIIYTIKLNTKYDEAAGTISVNPSEVVKYRYNSSRSTTESTFDFNTGLYKYWLGFESSAAVWGKYLYIASNDGFVHCINLNTMKIVWVQDVWDDANGTIVLEEDEANRTAYLYCGPSLHFTQDAEAKGNTPLFKIDAVTGEIIWKNDRTVLTKSGASGGIQATAILGQGSMSDLIIIPFARVYTDAGAEDDSLGYTVAINKHTGELVWEQKTNFSWSSPVAVYDSNNEGYVIQPDSHGKVYFFNGATGSRYSILDTESKNFESTGVAYGNMFVIGNKDKKIFGIRIS